MLNRTPFMGVCASQKLVEKLSSPGVRWESPQRADREEPAWLNEPRPGPGEQPPVGPACLRARGASAAARSNAPGFPQRRPGLYVHCTN
jgi:hypothetical protein